MNPSDLQAVLERGQRAKTLLSHPSYAEAMRDLEFHHTAAMVACAPGQRDAEALSYHHHQLHALRDLAATLAGYAEAAEDVEKTLADTAEQNEDDFV